ncbi:glycosyltransferase [Sporosarcina thermotolerans]|uniref:Glycosyltransferase n=1 Tax=Sporosarcina thermotolerans TaxID=633404 RepID=A0AAW9A562_9BACL|nr:glycosyltransferase [Sporosarcina thermotolerans]MDW0116307.1 glycosyltransferase [Sporosarcina thermotolerans]
MMDRKYSVLMSVYHKENPSFLKASIDSMIKQTLKPNDFVIVKDGKLTKDLDEIINEYNEREPDLFNIVSLEKNIGLGRALDEGLKYCKNELVARMDSDDISLPARCMTQVELFMSDPKLSIVGTIIDEFHDSPDNIVSSRVVPTTHDDIVKFIKRRSPFNHPTVMFKKSEVIRCGGYGNFRRKQDLDLFSRMINNDCKSANIDIPLLLFRSNEGNFKRRKSWSYCKSYIEVEYAIWKRGHCTLFDLIYVVIGQFIMYLSPMWFLKILSNKYLRKEYSK